MAGRSHRIREALRPVMRRSGASLVRSEIQKRYFRIIGHRHLVTVPIESVRCRNDPFKKLQGCAGEPIALFPPSEFFRVSINEPVRAHSEYAAWLREWLLDRSAYTVPASRGGWANGSLVREVRRVHRESGIILGELDSAIPALVDEAISQRVDHYLGVFQSIRSHGLKRLQFPPIYCLDNGTSYGLENGHHRTAALWVLGHRDVEIMITPKALV